MAPFDGNGILTAEKLAGSWVRSEVKAPVSVLTTREQRPGLPRLQFRVTLNKFGLVLKRRLHGYQS